VRSNWPDQRAVHTQPPWRPRPDAGRGSTGYELNELNEQIATLNVPSPVDVAGRCYELNEQIPTPRRWAYAYATRKYYELNELNEQYEGNEQDPNLDARPDLADDATHWRQLLRGAYALDGNRSDGLFGALHGLRCSGARLSVARGHPRLLPGEIESSAYRDWRERWLMPHREALTLLLGQLTSARVA
jgi:hypothetical protein